MFLQYIKYNIYGNHRFLIAFITAATEARHSSLKHYLPKIILSSCLKQLLCGIRNSSQSETISTHKSRPLNIMVEIYTKWKTGRATKKGKLPRQTDVYKYPLNNLYIIIFLLNFFIQYEGCIFSISSKKKLLMHCK